MAVGFFQIWDMTKTIDGVERAWSGYGTTDLFKILAENPTCSFVNIFGTMPGLKYEILMCALEGTQVRDLCLSYNAMGSRGAQSLANGLRNSNITSLSVYANQLGSTGVKYLADVLKETRITHLDLGANDIGDEGMEHLAEGLKNTYINSLDVGHNGIGSKGVKCLTDVLQYTNITSLILDYRNMGLNNKGDVSARCLAQVLKDTELEFDRITQTRLNEAISNNKKIAFKIQDAFQKLLVQSDLEFSIPTETESLDIGDYLYFIKTLNDFPNVKAHIFCFFHKNNHDTNPNITQKVNEFVKTLPAKFNRFINNNLTVLVKLFPNYDYLDMVKQCEDSGLSDIVKNLLLHRELYYVDDDQEILHPYIYKMLNKYGMPLYNEQIDNNKKANVIFYFQNHIEIDGAQEIIDLLNSLK